MLSKPKHDPLLEKTLRLRALRLAASKAVSPFQHPTRAWKLNDELTFGKHRGRTIAEAIEADRDWVTWALENIRSFDLDAEAQMEYDAADDPRAPEMIRRLGEKG